MIKECFPSALSYRNRNEMCARAPSYRSELERIVHHFIREAKRLANLRHENIVHVHQIFEENATAYMVMDFVDGPDLLDTIEGNAPGLSAARVETIAETLLYAIKYVHACGFLHRDISPDNILINDRGEPVIIDFGSAREHSEKQTRVLSRLKFVKDGYSPQEFYLAGGEQGPWSDLYSLAATLYHLVAGVSPADSQARLAAVAAKRSDPYEPLAGKVRGYPLQFLKAIDKALALLPAQRFQSADEWLQFSMSRPATGEVISQTLAASLSDLGMRTRAAIVASAVLLVGGLIWLGAGSGDPPAAGRTVAALTVSSLPPGQPSVSLPGDAALLVPVDATEVPRVAALAAIEVNLTTPPLFSLIDADYPRLTSPPPFPGAVSLTRTSIARPAPPMSIPDTLTAAPSADAQPDTGVTALIPITVVADGSPELTSIAEIPQPVRLTGVDPVDPIVSPTALPDVGPEAAVVNLEPPDYPTAIADMQVEYAYWEVLMPFRSTVERLRNADVIRIDAVASSANLAVSGAWINEDVVIYSFNGENLTPGTSLSAHILSDFAIDPDGFARASVRYRDPGSGSIERGLLAVPVVYRIGLADGTTVEASMSDLAWRFEVTRSESTLREGDVLTSELISGTEFSAPDTLAQSLATLVAADAASAAFSVLRQGSETTVEWPLARQ